LKLKSLRRRRSPAPGWCRSGSGRRSPFSRAFWRLRCFTLRPPGTALTVFFYPPLFYLLLAIGYALFGVSHAVAQGLESAFVLAAALGGFALARKFMSAPAALGAGLALIAAPQVASGGGRSCWMCRRSPS
jgi:hypothetical protein